VGAESGSDRVLAAMEKGVRVAQIREAARRAHEAGLQVGLFLQFGYPGEGLEEIAATRRLLRECAPDEIGISVSYPLPGTRFHERVKGQLGAPHWWTGTWMMLGPSTRFYRSLYRGQGSPGRALRQLRACKEPPVPPPVLVFRVPPRCRLASRIAASSSRGAGAGARLRRGGPARAAVGCRG
jgi:hypothetical protein